MPPELTPQTVDITFRWHNRVDATPPVEPAPTFIRHRNVRRRGTKKGRKKRGESPRYENRVIVTCRRLPNRTGRASKAAY